VALADENRIRSMRVFFWLALRRAFTHKLDPTSFWIKRHPGEPCLLGGWLDD